MAETVEVFEPQKECMSASYHSVKIHEIKLDSFGSGNPKWRLSLLCAQFLSAAIVAQNCATELHNMGEMKRVPITKCARSTFLSCHYNTKYIGFGGYYTSRKP